MLTEYIKFDKYAITLSIMLIILGVIFSAFYVSRAKEKRSLKVILCTLTIVLMEGMIVAADMRILTVCVLAFSVVIYVINRLESDSDNMLAIAGSVLIFVNAVLIGACVTLAYKYLGAVTVQAVVACVAMQMDKSVTAMMLIIVGVLVSVAAYFVYCGVKDISVYTVGYLYLYIVAFVWNIMGRFLPAYTENVAAYVMMYGSFVAVMLAGGQLIITRNSYKALQMIPIMMTGVIGMVMSAGYNLTACVGLQLVIQLGGLLGVLILNYLTGRKMYTNLVCLTGIALLPIADVALKLSVFKGLIKIVGIQWNMLAGISIIILEIAIGKWINAVGDRKARGVYAVSVMTFVCCLVIGLTPMITQYWIYPMMSGGEMMIANISVQDIPTMDIVICVGLVVIMSGVPIIPIARANNIINKN